MKRALIATILASMFSTGLALYWHLSSPPRARCGWCYQGDCYNSSICGSGCVCAKRGTDPRGVCLSLQ